jgi:hypothetical protein
MTNPHAVITTDEAQRAIDVDCEGFVDQSPTLLGLPVGDTLEQVVLETR